MTKWSFLLVVTGLTLCIASARADWQTDMDAANTTKDKAEAARLFDGVAKDETAPMETRWVAVANAAATTPSTSSQ